MSTTPLSTLADLQDIAGLHLLGRGLNPLDWASKSKECQKVGDTASDKRSISYNDNAYAVGKHVDFSLETASHGFSATFASGEHYEQHLHTHLNAPGHYGAFSAGFRTTFGKSLDSFVNQTAALYSHSECLWKLSLSASPATGTQAFRKRISDLPDTFDRLNPERFVALFVDFGADIVTEVVVGGTLNYAMTAPADYLGANNDIQSILSAEYRAFISGPAGTSISEGISRHFEHRRCTLTTLGGQSPLHFDAHAPSNCHEEFQAWRHSLNKAPKVVTLDTSPVFHFVEPGAIRDALKQAYHWYTRHEIQIHSSWQHSDITLGDTPLERPASAETEPSLHIVFVQSETRQRHDSWHPAPPPSADDCEFEQYWSSVSLLLEHKQRQGFKLLLSTARWPRAPRYFPSERMREALLQYGARPQTLEHWERLSLDMEPCALAGLSYALAGNDSETRGIDGIAAGFGKPGKTLNPTVKICAHFAHDSFGRMKAVKSQATVLDGQTPLYVLHNASGNQLALGLDPHDKTRLALQPSNSGALDQLWYMPQQEQRYSAIKQPTLLINYQTGACLQGHRDQSDCRLTALGDWPEDDVLWDLRGDDASFHLLMVYFFPDALCLTQYNTRHAAVRNWRSDGMHWTRTLSTP